MNRDVLRRQMFARGGVAYPMQNGGMAPAPLPADPGPMPAPAPMPPMDPGNADMGQVAQAAMQNGVDPAMLEAMLTQYASGLDDLENAQDYETVMNGIRGDQQPIQQRYQELANVVGPEDAQQTPESVLTLVQPVMMMASVDQGIGSLAAEQMAAPVQGPMAEGIMSTVDMPAPEPEPMAAPAPMAGGPDPVNFNQGGEVQYFADGGVALPQNPLSKAYQDKLPLYQQILGVEDREKAFQDQKNMTQAQMLFDIAQGALMFATPGERNMSPAERLAQAFTPVLGNIGTRAGELQKFKQSQAEQDRALRLQALGSAEQTLAARRAVEAQKALALRGEDRADQTLTLQERAQTLDEKYKLGMLAVEQAAQNAIKLGSEAKTNQLTYLTNPERLNKYAMDELGDETALFEQALADYVKPSYSWNGTSYTKTAQPQLARQVQEALRTRVQNGHEIPSIAGFNATASRSAPDRPLDDSVKVKPRLNSPEFKQQLFNSDTGINYDSPLWEDVPLNIIDKDIAYYRATGPSQVGQRISNVVSEYGRELFGAAPMNEEGRELVTATKDINNLREVINQELVNWSDDRVLKTTQDALRALAQDLTPGVFKFDESAAATLKSLKGNMGRAFQYYASMDPEYTPEAQNRFTEKQVTNARARTSQIQSLLAEVIALEKIYTGYLQTLSPGGPKGAAGGVKAARAMIRKMAEQ